MDDVIQVEAEDQGGTPRPIAFHWNGRRFDISHHGRSWDEGGEHHYLVMTADLRSFELVFQPSVGQWRLRKSPADFGMRPPAV